MLDNEEIDYEGLDNLLNKEIESQLKDLENLRTERAEIGTPKKVVDAVSQIVWEQLILQIAGTAGRDFIKQNHDLNLSLSKADHILNEDSFARGEMPSHNFKNFEKYNDRYQKWDANFTDHTHEHLNKNYRDAFDRDRPMGSKSMAMDHTVPVAEMLRDKKVAAFMSEEQKIKFANDTNINLKPLDSAANQSKSDKTVSEWFESTRDGKHPYERFNIDKEEVLKNDKTARSELDRQVKQGQEEAKAEGYESIKSEAKMVGTMAAQAIAVALFAKLTRHIFTEIIKWLSDKERNAKTLIENIKKGITDFFLDFKNNVLLSVDIGMTVILTSLFGEIVPFIRKILMFFVIGGRTAYEVIKYLKNPATKKKDTPTVILEVGRIAVIGLTAAGGIALGNAITVILAYYCPPLRAQIPLLGSWAGIIGIFLGGLIAGVAGALIVYQIDRTLMRRELSENIHKQLVVQGNALALQDQQFNLYVDQVDNRHDNALTNIESNIKQATEEMGKARDSLNEERTLENDQKRKDIEDLLDSTEW